MPPSDLETGLPLPANLDASTPLECWKAQGYAGRKWPDQVSYPAGQRPVESDLSPLTLAPLTFTDWEMGVPRGPGKPWKQLAVLER